MSLALKLLNFESRRYQVEKQIISENNGGHNDALIILKWKVHCLSEDILRVLFITVYRLSASVQWILCNYIRKVCDRLILFQGAPVMP